MNAKSSLRALASLALIGTFLIVADSSVHASVTRAAAHPAAKEHKALKGKSVPAHHVIEGVLHKWPVPKARDHDQSGCIRNCAKSGPFHAYPVQRATSFQVGIDQACRWRGADGGSSRTRSHCRENTPYVGPNCGCPSEPSEASDGNVVVYSDNDDINFSVNYGSTFVSMPMGAPFSTDPEGGPCCDQQVQYVPSINRFVWLAQYWPGPTGADLQRLTVFPPSSVTAGGLTGSFSYWDLYSESSTYKIRDFPDLAVGTNYLYVSTNLGKGGSVYQSVIERIGLQNLAKGLNLAAPPQPWYYVIGGLFFGRVAQNTGSTAYWAQPANTSQMNISWWPESGTSWYGPHTINNYTWPNANYASKDPDGNNWNSTYTSAVLAAAVTPGANGSHLWLAWPAGTGTGKLSWLSQPNVQLLEVSIPSISFAGQTSIWNPSYAFSFPALAVSVDGNLGIDLGWGGHGTNWTNTAVTDWTDTPYAAWNMTSSTASDGMNRWGDYIAIRPEYGESVTGGPLPLNGFTATGIQINLNTDTKSRVWGMHFIAFNG